MGSRQHLPPSISLVGKVDIEKFETLHTTNAIVNLKTDAQTKALLSTLKKLFRQRGAGRVVGAFHRGIPADVNKFIDPVLRILENEGFAWKLKDVYHPVRKETGRANHILDNPYSSSDSLLGKVKSLR